jgi:hypothetical protein
MMHRHAVEYSTYPRGPRSGPGCSVPVRHHLIGPIRPTRRRNAISPHGGLYAMPSAVRECLGDPRVVPGFHCAFLPDMPSSPTPGSPTSICSRRSMPTWPSPFDHRLGTPEIPAIRFARGADFVASLLRFRYGLPGCSPPCTDRAGASSPRGLLLPRFQRIGLPPRCWLCLQQ